MTVAGDPAFAIGSRPRQGAFRGGLAIADQGISSATTFFCTVLIGRSTSKEEFGTYVLGLTVLAWFTNLQAAFVTTPYLYRQASLSGTDRRRLAGSTLLHQVTFAGLATGAIALFAVAAGAWAWAWAPNSISSISRALAICVGAVMLKEYGRQLSFAHRRPGDALLLDTVCFVLQVGAFVWLVQSGRVSPASAYLVTGLACGLVAAAWLVNQRREFLPTSSTAMTHLRDHWVFGKWMFAGYVVAAFAKDIYGWVLAGSHGTAATAELGACLGIVMLASPVIVGVGNHLGPSYARLLADQGPAALARSVHRGTWAAAAFVVIEVLAIFLLGDWALGVVYGPQYAGNRTVLMGLAIGLGMSVLTMPIGAGLLAMRRADFTFRAAAAGGFATLVLGIALARAFGPLGAAIGFLTASALEGVTKLILFRRARERALNDATQ